MSALIFLGQPFTDDASFARAYPAYGYYAKLVRAGADSPHKIEIELHKQSQRLRNGARRGSVRRRRKSAA